MPKYVIPLSLSLSLSVEKHSLWIWYVYLEHTMCIENNILNTLYVLHYLLGYTMCT